MQYTIKVKCEGYLVLNIDADSKEKALQIIEDSPFYVANDYLDDAPAETADVEIVWCKDRKKYDAEQEIEFKKRFSYLNK